jgi:hypothetical protein
MAPLRSPDRSSATRSLLTWVIGLSVVALVGAGLVSITGVVDWNRIQQARDVGQLGGTPVIPEQYQPIIEDAAERCPAVPSRILAAQIATESRWQPDAVSPVGAEGIAQFMPSTWSQYGIDANGDGVRDVWDPEDAIHSAAELNCLNRRLVSEVSGTPLHNILAAYNAGHGAVRKYDGIPPFPETEQYVQKVLDLAQRYPAPGAS